MRIWIDLENSPHGLFFRPIIGELQSRGHEVVLTARDFAQTLELASVIGVPLACIGHGESFSYAGKAFAGIWRALQLIRFMRGKNADLALSHGSRAQVLAAAWLGMPSYACFDYDYTDTRVFQIFCRHVLVPEVAIGNFQVTKRVPAGFFVPYPGIKEEVYVGHWPLDGAIVSRLGLDASGVIAVLRPPATAAHYSTRASDELFESALSCLLDSQNTQLVLLPRYRSQALELAARASLRGRALIPTRAIDALSLMAVADLVVSGGGTMIREAAVLGTPAYSVFAGPVGTIDQLLEKDGRLTLIRRQSDVERIAVHKKATRPARAAFKAHLAGYIVERLLELHNSKRGLTRVTG